ncbi:MAG: hypothetical protein GF381_03490 [Candidatus Pacebacteria bacterium]|nr:hypothetical protein [Candidatus Paceibacterota bacterium]
MSSQLKHLVKSTNSANNQLSTNPKPYLPWADSLSSLPSQPGVYWFLNAEGKVLYVGKAKNLKKRVSSYRRLNQLSERKVKLVRQASQVEHQVLTSELEALLIEAELIRLHQPPYNILLKDDKSPIYLQITTGDFPKVNTLRRREINQQPISQTQGTILGPYQSAYKLKQVLKIARKIFPWCDQPAQVEPNNKDGGELRSESKAQLEKMAENRLKTNLKKTPASKTQPNTTATRQACFYYHIDQCPGACLAEISSEEYQQTIDQLILFLKGKKKTVIKNLRQKMEQFAQELKFEQAQKIKKKLELIAEVTSPKYRLKPDLVLPALQASRTKNSLLHLRRILQDFMSIPSGYQLSRIEGYDVSNIQGKAAAVSLVAFSQGQPDKSNYRLFNIRSLDTPNDYQMMKEALIRRQKHPEWGKPNLVVIDGGKGQLRAALSVWEWSNPVISIAKDPDRIILPVQAYRDPKTNRLKTSYKTVRLPSNHPTLQLVQRIRDESHRFAKKQHTRLRTRQMLSQDQ